MLGSGLWMRCVGGIVRDGLCTGWLRGVDGAILGLARRDCSGMTSGRQQICELLWSHQHELRKVRVRDLVHAHRELVAHQSHCSLVPAIHVVRT